MQKSITGRLIPMLFLAVSAAMLTGCRAGYGVQLRDRAVIQAIGVDIGRDGQYQVTAQYFLPSEGEKKQNSGIVKASGRTVEEAVHRMNAMQGREMFFAANELIAAGKGSIPKIEEIVGYFIRKDMAQSSVDVILTEGTAEELIEANLPQNEMPAIAVVSTVKNGNSAGIIPDCSLFSCEKNLSLRCTEYLLLPMFSVSKEGENDSIGYEGTVLVRNGSIAAYCTREETEGLILLREGRKNFIWTLGEEQNGIISVSLNGLQRKTRSAVENGKGSASVEIGAKCRLTETASLPTDASPQLLARAERLTEAHIRKLAEAAVQLCRRTSTDLLNFGQKAIISSPAEMKNSMDQYEKRVLPELFPEITVKCRINGIVTDIFE